MQTYTKSEAIISYFFEKQGIPSIRWHAHSGPFSIGFFGFYNKSGAIEIEDTYLKVYLYFGPNTMEVFNGCLKDPDSLKKLRVILMDLKLKAQSSKIRIF